MNVSKSSISDSVGAVKVYSYQRPHELKVALDRSAPAGVRIGVHMSQSNVMLRNAFMAMCFDAYDASSSLCHGNNLEKPEAIERYQAMVAGCLQQSPTNPFMRNWGFVGVHAWETFFCFYTDEGWNGEVKPRAKFTHEDDTRFADSFEDLLFSFFGLYDANELVLEDKELPVLVQKP